MATVYRAHDRRLDRRVALKLMHPHLADSPDFVSRFRREARAAARLSNPGVVAVYDQGSLDGVAYLVMEYVEGPNLRDLIAQGPLSVKEALGLVSQLLRPLGAAHRAGLVHRDIKPENVLLPSDGSEAKVADFGLARAVTEVAQTTTGNVLGTVAYLAPELITSGTSSSRADVFSAGIVLYELLTGVQPFSADSPIQIAFRNVHEDVPLPSALVPDMPADVDELVATMTRRNPEERPEDADAALALLRDVHDELTVSELAVRRGGGTTSMRDLEAMKTGLEAEAPAVRAASAPSPQEWEDSQDSPHVGMRTVSLPIGSIGPQSGRSARRAQRSALAADARQTDRLATRPSSSRLTRRALLGGGVLALALAGGGGAAAWYFVAGPGRKVTVPAIVGKSQEDAQAEVEALGLVWASPSRAYSDTVSAGAVISCEPAPGQQVPQGQAVAAVVSRGVETMAVPNVVGKTEAEARKAIQGAGLTVGSVTKEYSADVASGKVISTNPAAKKVVNHSTPVDIVVSQGKQPTTVPDVTGMSQDEATTALENAGLKRGTVKKDYSDTVPKDAVISSSPKAGESAYYGDAVSITISRGPENVEVPDVTGMSEEEAVSALEDAGLKARVEYSLGGLFDKVRSTEPAAGTRVKTGSTVTVTVR